MNRASHDSRITSYHFSAGATHPGYLLALLVVGVRNDAVKYVPSAGATYSGRFRYRAWYIGDDASSRGTAVEILGTPGSLGWE